MGYVWPVFGGAASLVPAILFWENPFRRCLVYCADNFVAPYQDFRKRPQFFTGIYY